MSIVSVLSFPFFIPFLLYFYIGYLRFEEIPFLDYFKDPPVLRKGLVSSKFITVQRTLELIFYIICAVGLQRTPDQDQYDRYSENFILAAGMVLFIYAFSIVTSNDNKTKHSPQ